MKRAAYMMSSYVLDEYDEPIAFQGSFPIFPTNDLNKEKALGYTMNAYGDQFLLNIKTNTWDRFTSDGQLDKPEYHFDNWRKCWTAIENTKVPGV